jgi:hypothetical protein
VANDGADTYGKMRICAAIIEFTGFYAITLRNVVFIALRGNKSGLENRRPLGLGIRVPHPPQAENALWAWKMGSPARFRLRNLQGLSEGVLFRDLKSSLNFWEESLILRNVS